MKTKAIVNLKKHTLLLFLVALMTFSFDSCAVKSAFLNSSVVPAAQGKVKVKRDRKNQNYVIKIEVTGLAEVERLQTSKHNYVVWMETEQGMTKNLGQLNSSSGFLSDEMRASLETVSSYKPARIYITAEYSSDVQYPGEQVVLSTGRF
jgi:hypothetical protein